MEGKQEGKGMEGKRKRARKESKERKRARKEEEKKKMKERERKEELIIVLHDWFSHFSTTNCLAVFQTEILTKMSWLFCLCVIAPVLSQSYNIQLNPEDGSFTIEVNGSFEFFLLNLFVVSQLFFVLFVVAKRGSPQAPWV
jgi:hypothetical protein